MKFVLWTFFAFRQMLFLICTRILLGIVLCLLSRLPILHNVWWKTHRQKLCTTCSVNFLSYILSFGHMGIPELWFDMVWILSTLNNLVDLENLKNLVNWVLWTLWELTCSSRSILSGDLGLNSFESCSDTLTTNH